MLQRKVPKKDLIMKILIIHANKNAEKIRRTILNFSFCLLRYAPEHEYFLHCYGDPVTEKLKNEKFDLIILDVTFLCYRWAKGVEYSLNLLKKYKFIRESDAVKVALPQDDYDHSAVLDKWMSEWGINIIFSVLPDYSSVLYPLSGKIAKIIPSFTGYVDEEDIEITEKYALAFESRTIDVGYRAFNLPPNFGSFGQVKAQLGANFAEACRKINANLNLDISNKKEDTILGVDWLEFLGNSRFTLGCESGSSILDPYGEIKKKVQEYLKIYPDADFKSVEAACFPGEDRKYIFNAISPRIFETAIARSCQILLEGDYSGIVKPDVHYIPLKEDFSNISEVAEKMKDTENIKKIINNCYEELISSGKYTYRNFAGQILGEEIPAGRPFRRNIEKIINMANKISAKKGFAYIPPNTNCNADDIKEIKKANSKISVLKLFTIRKNIFF